MPSHTRPARMGNTQYEIRSMIFAVYFRSCMFLVGREERENWKEETHGRGRVDAGN